MTTTEPLRHFDAVAGQYREYLLGLLAARPPTAGQIIAAVDEKLLDAARAECLIDEDEEARDGD